MLNVFPDYYKSFKCIADRCEHSCCIGWEIDVDKDSLNKYSALDGEMGKRLKENISQEDTPHFVLDKDERCPFLNERGLCELILYGGEDMLCGICTDHPRFRNFLPDRTETGLGLCCEEAARLIIDGKNPSALVYEGECTEEDAYADTVISLRDELLCMANEAALPYCERAENILSRCHLEFPNRSPEKWAELYLSLERMDNEWTLALERLRNCNSVKPHYDRQSANLLSYFIYRHLPGAYEDGNVQGRVFFAVLSTYIITLLCSVCDDKSIYDIARLYSAEIEYSDENLSRLFDLI